MSWADSPNEGAIYVQGSPKGSMMVDRLVGNPGLADKLMIFLAGHFPFFK
jgi:hypothetical protein